MLGFNRPRCSLKIGPRHAAWAELTRDLRGRSSCSYRVAELADGLVRSSPGELNITDPVALEARLRELIGLRKGQTRPAVLASLLELDVVPSRADEREALIRWRLERDVHCPLTEAKVVSQVLGPKTILAVVIRDQVLRQYEAVCEAAGLAPVEVDIASFRLWNLFLNAAAPQDPVAGLCLLDGGFTLLIFHEGRLAFQRIKMRSQDGFEDLANSLAYYTETHPEAVPKRLTLISDAPEPELMPRIAEKLKMEVVELTWTDLRRAGWVSVEDAVPAEALPAVASLYQ